MSAPFTMRIHPGSIRRWPQSPTAFTWVPSQADRRQADDNHGQTLERLNERGGLDWSELLAVLEHRRWRAEAETVAAARCRELHPQGAPQ